MSLWGLSLHYFPSHNRCNGMIDGCSHAWIRSCLLKIKFSHFCSNLSIPCLHFVPFISKFIWELNIYMWYLVIKLNKIFRPLVGQNHNSLIWLVSFQKFNKIVSDCVQITKYKGLGTCSRNVLSIRIIISDLIPDLFGWVDNFIFIFATIKTCISSKLWTESLVPLHHYIIVSFERI